MSATIDLHDRDAVAAERDRRLAKLEALRDQGIEPYPPVYERDQTVGALRERFAGLAGTRPPARRRRSPGGSC